MYILEDRNPEPSKKDTIDTFIFCFNSRIKFCILHGEPNVKAENKYLNE